MWDVSRLDQTLLDYHIRCSDCQIRCQETLSELTRHYLGGLSLRQQKRKPPYGGFRFCRRRELEIPNPCSTNRQDCRFGSRSDPSVARARAMDGPSQSLSLRQTQKGPVRGFLCLGKRAGDVESCSTNLRSRFGRTQCAPNG